MLVLSRQRKELLLRLIFQQRYKNVLEAWLYIHVPFTIALLVFAVVHIVAVFYYGRMPSVSEASSSPDRERSDGASSSSAPPAAISR